jgi:TetR/AcrR family transcriptional regulator, repressor for divergent bdcA
VSATTKTAKRPKRPAFDREQGVAVAQDLFHARGYDAVGVADLTQALNIVPPSLYAAYGSKVDLYERALRRYAETTMLPLDTILRDDRSPVEALAELLEIAARQYSRDDTCRGCMVTEGMRADDPVARERATEIGAPAATAIRTYAKKHFGDRGDEIADYVLMTLRGLSSYACLGSPQDSLIRCARTAARALSA